MMTDLILVVVAVLFLWGVKSRKNSTEDSLLSVEQTTALRGMAALGIVLHHLSYEVDGTVFPMLQRFGFLVVSLFFFWAGYGLRLSLRRNKTYLDGFIKKRLSKILLPFLIAGILYIVYHVLFTPGFSVKELIPIQNGQPNLIVDNSWYVVALLFFYVVFYFAYRCFQKWGDIPPLVAVFVCVVAYTVLLKYVLHWGSWWTNAAFTFFLGLLVGTFEKQCILFLKKRYWLTLTGTALLFIVTTGLTVFKLGGNQTPLKIIFDWGACSFLCLLVAVFCYKYRIGNRSTTWLGGISYEIYLVHGLAIRIFTDVIPVPNDILLIVVVVALSTLLAYGFNLLNRKFLLKKI